MAETPKKTSPPAGAASGRKKKTSASETVVGKPVQVETLVPPGTRRIKKRTVTERIEVKDTPIPAPRSRAASSSQSKKGNIMWPKTIMGWFGFAFACVAAAFLAVWLAPKLVVFTVEQIKLTAAELRDGKPVVLQEEVDRAAAAAAARARDESKRDFALREVNLRAEAAEREAAAARNNVNLGPSVIPGINAPIGGNRVASPRTSGPATQQGRVYITCPNGRTLNESTQTCDKTLAAADVKTFFPPESPNSVVGQTEKVYACRNLTSGQTRSIEPAASCGASEEKVFASRTRRK